jgi:hypothetical protein
MIDACSEPGGKIVKVNAIKGIPANQVEQKCWFYWTALENCSCGETMHLAQMSSVKFPCSHQSSLGAFQSICPTDQLQQDASPIADEEYKGSVKVWR